METEATLTMEGLAITAVHLDIAGTVAGISAEAFESITKAVEQNCLISKALKIAISSQAHLVA